MPIAMSDDVHFLQINSAATKRAGAWRFFIDRGVTFTDVVAQSPDGALTCLKLLSQDERYGDAALEAIRRCLKLPPGAPIPATWVADARMGTTVATNALLERKGERVVLVTTRGFKDQLHIGYQHRPKLFALNIERPDMLYSAVIEANERITAEGAVLRPLDEAARDIPQSILGIQLICVGSGLTDLWIFKVANRPVL